MLTQHNGLYYRLTEPIMEEPTMEILHWAKKRCSYIRL